MEGIKVEKLSSRGRHEQVAWRLGQGETPWSLTTSVPTLQETKELGEKAELVVVVTSVQNGRTNQLPESFHNTRLSRGASNSFPEQK